MGEWRWDILTGVAESVGLCSWRLKEGDRVLSALTTPRAGLMGLSQELMETRGLFLFDYSS